MNVDIRFPAYDAQGRTFVTWRPVEVKLRVTAAPAGAEEVPVRLTSKSSPGGGRLSFATTLTHQGVADLEVRLPANGTEQTVWVGGSYQSPSSRYGDVSMEAHDVASGASLASHPLMVRIRKDANTLTAAERDRFLEALARLNGGGTGPYRDFRDMHIGGPPDDEAHGGAGFLPWHRAYLLDFERELQAIDAEVSLPYWRFDAAAPKLFAAAFMGVPDRFMQVRFSPGHPLLNWVAMDRRGVERGGGVGPNTVPRVVSEEATLHDQNGDPHPDFAAFREMQFNPHGAAHMSHRGGPITDPTRAPQDPLFFLLHCNVDRLWAKWQWVTGIHDPADPRAYDETVDAWPGHRTNDLLWPWCGPDQPDRPPQAPGGVLRDSPITRAPGPRPRVIDMIDYLGTVSDEHMGFAYDDVAFLK